MRTLLSALALTTLLVTPSLAASGKLVLYTSQPNEDAQQTVDAFTAKYPEIEVEWIRDGTTKVMAKLAAEFEAGAPQPDVLLIADMVTMEGLKAEGRLMAHEDADVSAYDPAIMDEDKTYFSTKLITTGIVYNTNAVMVPTSYQDLLKEEAAGKIAMPSPLTSGAATIHMATLTSNPDLGWAYYEGLAVGRDRAGRDPVDCAEPAGRQGVRRLPAVARRSATCSRPRLPCRPSGHRPARRLPGARRNQADGLRPSSGP